MKKGVKLYDSIIILLIPVCGMIATVLLNLSYLSSILFFLGLPVLYLAFRVSFETLLKTGLFSIIFSLPLSLVIDYIITADQGWFVPNSIYQVLGIVPVEDLFFGLLSVWSITIIYEYFFDKSDKKLFEPQFKYLLVSLVGILGIFCYLYFFYQSALLIPYAFLIVCSVVLLVPLVSILFFHRELIKKYAFIAGYFFFVSACWEFSALYIDQWQYLGENYVGWIHFFNFAIPIEEFVFFWIVYAASILAWYEFLDDDCR